MIGEFNSDREVWYLETSTLTVADRSTTDVQKLDTVWQTDSPHSTAISKHLDRSTLERNLCLHLLPHINHNNCGEISTQKKRYI
jgi:hypothetical protein